MNEFQVSDFLDQIYEDCLMTAEDTKLLDKAGDKEVWESFCRKRLAQAAELLRLPVLEERYAIPLQSVLLEKQVTREGIQIEKYRVDAIRNLPFSVHVLRMQQRLPQKAVVFLNGHDPRGAAGAYQPLYEGADTLGMELAKQGYLVLVPELMGMGEAKRKDAKAGLGACESCAQIEPWLLNCGLHLVGIRVWEAMKTLDFAQRTFGIRHFAAYGISGGGHVCNYFGVLDERIEAMILSGYCNSYRHSTLAQVHCICNYIPGQIALGESWQVTALAAPGKKLFVLNGRQDPIFPEQGSEEAFCALKEIYHRLGRPEYFDSLLFEGGHEIRIPEVCSWLEKAIPAETEENV